MPCKPMSKEQFIRLLTADRPDAPAYYTYDAILNTRERATLENNPEHVLHPVDLDEVLRRVTRAHRHSTSGTPSSMRRATSPAASMLDCAEPGREQEAALRLGRIGFDHIRGYLQGGMEALADRPDLVRPIGRVTAMAIAS